MEMQDRLDPLIADRAPWLFAPHPPARWAKQALDRVLGYQRTIAIATAVQHMPADRLMRTMARLIARRVEISGLSHIPISGPALIVANHPTGIADGLVLYRLLERRRPDAFYFANVDILKVLPQLEALIAPVEWRQERRSHGKTRRTMAYTRAALDQGRLGVIFPSGRLAKRRGIRLVERPWMASAAMIARKFDLPVIPIHIRARNSALFYGFDALHPSLRDITLFHETLNKAQMRFTVTVGTPIPAHALPQNSEAAIAALRQATLGLGESGAQGQLLLRPLRLPVPPRLAPRWS